MYRPLDQLVGKTTGRLYTKSEGNGMVVEYDLKFSSLERSHYPYTRSHVLYYDHTEGS